MFAMMPMMVQKKITRYSLSQKSMSWAHHWRKLLYVLSILLLGLVYLSIANGYFYVRLGTAGLAWPQTSASYLIGDISGTRQVYVALGDSLTSGVGVQSFNQSYAYRIAQQIAAKGTSIKLTPLATPSYKSIDIINHYLDSAIALQPDIVTVLIGVNDVHGMLPTARQFSNNYETIIRRLKTETKAKIYAIAVPYIGTNGIMWPPYRGYYSLRTQAFNRSIQELAQKYAIHYVDLYTATLSYASSPSGYYSTDEFHPSSEGYAIWAGAIAHDINN